MSNCTNIDTHWLLMQIIIKIEKRNMEQTYKLIKLIILKPESIKVIVISKLGNKIILSKLKIQFKKLWLMSLLNKMKFSS